MAFWLTVTRLATLLTVVLVLGLVSIWVRNYRQVRSRFTVGFLAFGGFLLAQNGFALYVYAVDATTSGWFAEIPALYNKIFMVLAVLQFAAIAVLAWVTLE